MTPRRAYCEACGYTESHDPNCPRPRIQSEVGFDKWIARELPRATGYEIDLCRTVWLAASQHSPDDWREAMAEISNLRRDLDTHLALPKKLEESLQIGVLFGNYNEPLDAYGKRLVRAVLLEIDSVIQASRKGLTHE